MDFNTLCTNKNRKKYSIGELQNLQHYHNCLYTTWENVKTHKTAHFETNCLCILMLNAVNGKNKSKWTVLECVLKMSTLFSHTGCQTISLLVDSIVSDLLLEFIPDS